jgi:hypothetical protein
VKPTLLVVDLLHCVLDIQTTMDDLVGAGDREVGRFTYRGTHGDPLYGTPATGEPIEMRSIDIWRTENGEFVEH